MIDAKRRNELTALASEALERGFTVPQVVAMIEAEHGTGEETEAVDIVDRAAFRKEKWAAYPDGIDRG